MHFCGHYEPEVKQSRGGACQEIRLSGPLTLFWPFSEVRKRHARVTSKTSLSGTEAHPPNIAVTLGPWAPKVVWVGEGSVLMMGTWIPI